MVGSWGCVYICVCLSVHAHMYACVFLCVVCACVCVLLVAWLYLTKLQHQWIRFCIFVSFLLLPFKLQELERGFNFCSKFCFALSALQNTTQRRRCAICAVLQGLCPLASPYQDKVLYQGRPSLCKQTSPTTPSPGSAKSASLSRR